MDSCDSIGSIQCLSGGDREYDSRGESISAFLALHAATSSMLDPLSNFFDPPPMARSAFPEAASTPILNQLEVPAWSKRPRLVPSCTDLSGFDLASMLLQPVLDGWGDGASATSFPEPEGPSQLGSISGSALNEQAPLTAASNTSTGSGSNNNNGVTRSTTVRNRKKRSRASRRAPTTIITSDTTNFRAMVQEFTGIPAPPFGGLVSDQRSRLDLFGSAGLGPSDLLRPLAQRLQPPAVPPFSPPPRPPSSSSSSFSSFPDSIMDVLASTAASKSIAATANSTDLGLFKPPASFLNQSMPNPVLDLQSLSQSAQKCPIARSSILHPKSLGSSDTPESDHTSHTKDGGQVSAQLRPELPNLEPLERALSGNSNNNDNNDDNTPPDWHGDGARSSGNGDRGPERIGSRGEGTVDPWICVIGLIN